MLDIAKPQSSSSDGLLHQQQKPSLHRVQPQTARLPSGSRIAYVEVGAGDDTPLMFVHGSLCDYRYWEPQITALALQRRVIVVSLPFYFPVEDQPDERFSVDAHAEAVLALLAQGHWGKVHLIGHSRGGSVCFQAAGMMPSAFASLTLADPGGQIVDQGLDGEDGSPAPAPTYDENDPRMLATESIERGDIEGGVEMFVDAVSRPGFWRRSTEEFKVMARDNALTLTRQMRDVLPTYTHSAAGRITVPTLLINGEKSPPVFGRAGRALTEWIHDARRVEMKGASHGMNLSHAGEFNRLVHDFVDAVDGI